MNTSRHTHTYSLTHTHLHMLQVREPNEQKDGDLKNSKETVARNFSGRAAKITHMSESKRYLDY